MPARQAHLTSVPNLLTYGRIVAIPLIVGLLVTGEPALRWIAFALYVAAAVSDYFDGYLARRDGLSSPLGQMLDPIADKMLVGALLVTFAWDGTFSSWDLVPGLIILMREILVSGLREFMGDRKIAVTRLAKWKTTVQLVALGALIVWPLVPGIWILAELLLWLAAILTVMTGSAYFRGAWPVLAGGQP